MILPIQRLKLVVVILALTLISIGILPGIGKPPAVTSAQEEPKPSPTPVFDQKAALEMLREKIKGRESDPAGEVFDNIKDFTDAPAGRLLAVMEFGYARSLGVDCTHCHTPENWASDEKRAKNIAREMKAMAAKINGELLGSIKAFEGREGRDRPVINCTTCHRGEVKPALNLPR